MSLLDDSPIFAVEAIVEFARQNYGLAITDIQLLPSERDQNFKLTDGAGERFVLKISSGRDEPPLLEAQCQLLSRLSALGGAEIVPALDESMLTEIVDEHGKTYWTRLVTYVEGTMLADIRHRPPELLFEIGQYVHRMNEALAGFEHPALHRPLPWDLRCAKDIVAKGTEQLGQAQRNTVLHVAEQFRQHAIPVLARLPQSVIHNDINDGNLIVESTRGRYGVAGAIDVGDAVYSWSIGELAIAIAYSILDQADPLAAAAKVVRGYCRSGELSDDELTALFGLVCMRLCVSAVMAAKQAKARPDDPYLTISQGPITKTLPRLANIPYRFATAVFRQASGKPPIARSEAICDAIAAQSNEALFPLARGDDDQICPIDLSVASPILHGDPQAFDESKVTDAVEAELRRQRATIAVGGYLESRLIYTTDQFSADDGWLAEPRTLHLGVDLFTEAGRAVIAPLDAVVHSVKAIDKPLDYGTVVVLRHGSGDAEFYTLYGHLARRTQEHLHEGQQLARGDTLGLLGERSENGGWTPHLHFQLITDLLDLGHEFPGVGHATQRETWSCFSPDPNLLLGISQTIASGDPHGNDDAAKQRNIHVGGNLSLAYRNPIKMVRGWMQYLYDERGRRFLDAFNNVPHVGHCHPEVVESAERQLRLLNTNTRYLHDSLGAFASQLTATMPEPLSVCYFLNSASEANELALRLARAHTKRKAMVVLADSYHGNTTSLIEMSPYKHNGPGGDGPPDWVHTAPIPDLNRGEFRDPKTAGRQYSTRVAEIIDRLGDQGVCGFIAESCPSVGGQIILPSGYLTEVYKLVRKAGGVCIADEVQTAYGRLGEAFYGFELQNAVPDIVVLGKPIGNGHPIAAIVTRPEIAAAFDNGMEFFSTFGGNTVSCAIGSKVLEIVQRDQLQQNAGKVGDRLLAGLRRLQRDVPLIGDVRGSGFFLGVELVRNRETFEPADWEAESICNRMSEKGILIGTDGPSHNVLKIRPPMAFTNTNAGELIETLGDCFAELNA